MKVWTFPNNVAAESFCNRQRVVRDDISTNGVFFFTFSDLNEREKLHISEDT